MFFGGQQASFLLSAWLAWRIWRSMGQKGQMILLGLSCLLGRLALVSTDVDLKKFSTSKDTQCIEEVNQYQLLFHGSE